METNGLEIKLNGQPVCRAGFKTDRYHLNCMLQVVRHTEQTSDQIKIIVGGTEGPTLKLVNWVEQTLREGDKITIQIVSGNYDPPVSSFDTKKDLNALNWLNNSLKDILDPDS
ncbi:MAG: hypothetical protein SF052_15965 [Bacteroidia bacterium]|nr:hypothetical protein [Bacteroidia bacterium]